MKNRKELMDNELNQYLRALPDGDAPTTADYVAQGSALVTRETMLALRELLPEVRLKLSQVDAPVVFVQSVKLLVAYFEETQGGPPSALQERPQIAFALLYFLRGYDRIPDSIPEIGYVDDAAVINQVIDNLRPALREHWQHRNREWPAFV